MSGSVKAVSVRLAFISALFVVILTSLFGSALAQEGLTPVALGENKPAAISAAGEVAAFALQNPAPQTVSLQVLGMSPDFIPAARVIDPDGIVVQNVVNSASATIIQVPVRLASAGSYRIEARNLNPSAGDFILFIQSSDLVPAVTPIDVGQSVAGSVNLDAPQQSYTFDGAAETMLLTVKSDEPGAGSVVMLSDRQTGELLALNSMRLSGIRYRIPADATQYAVEIAHSGSSAPESYIVCLEFESGSATCGAQVAQQAPANPAPQVGSAACQVVANTGVNIRSNPGTGNPVIGSLAAGAAVAAIGRTPDGSWYQISYNGATGWVSAGVVASSGACGGVSTVNVPVVDVQQPVDPGVTPTEAPPVVSTDPTPAPADNGGGIITVPGGIDVSGGNDDPQINPNSDVTDAINSAVQDAANGGNSDGQPQINPGSVPGLNDALDCGLCIGMRDN